MDYDDHGLAAMPKLVGGPKYSRPPVTGVTPVERPPDPDDLPLASTWTDEDHALAHELGLDGHVSASSAGPQTSPSQAAEAAGHASSRRGLGGLLRSRKNGQSGAS